MSSHKPVHSIILDAGPILKNDPSISTLLAKSEQRYTVSSVISEIKDAEARSRVETTLLPFLTIRNPGIESIRVVTDFARKTGDLAVLSKPDIAVLALAYELECEKNGGDWRLRRTPGQKGINGPVPSKSENSTNEAVAKEVFESSNSTTIETTIDSPATQHDAASSIPSSSTAPSQQNNQDDQPTNPLHAAQNLDASSILNDDQGVEVDRSKENVGGDADDPDGESSGSEGWITPSNLKKEQAKDIDSSSVALAENKVMQVATITTDFAMQNVLLQLGLNLLSSTIKQVRHIKTYVLRCHACFEKTKDMSKQFCPRCGKPTLTRVSCSTNAKGEFQIHLKKNMQWSHRGDRFSIPKPVSGAANGKAGQSKGGGKGGWGQELILAEDQKEYVRAMSGQSRRKEKNLMDEDYLPSILTGDRGRAGGRPKVGAGRNVNSKKR
ncbi:MAG: Nin1 binding protein [Heterodermia speciosa]|uniref:20S-pre-rRNA D-site endonuclease NOB1 n=1 Tax=Heterodermia speciosa TaxID=116794 RepID=A0A8H3F1K8_9LECA|nr:MAG: Nin1 binding protein [Heterodermia speciosa]